MFCQELKISEQSVHDSNKTSMIQSHFRALETGDIASLFITHLVPRQSAFGPGFAWFRKR
jgi:hypothetical protein